MNKADAFDLFRRIKIRWPNFQLSEDLGLMAEVYVEDLEEFPYEDVKAAYKTFKGERFAPTLSEIVEVLDPSEIGEPWMSRRAGEMGFFEKKQEPDPNVMS